MRSVGDRLSLILGESFCFVFKELAPLDGMISEIYRPKNELHKAPEFTCCDRRLAHTHEQGNSDRDTSSRRKSWREGGCRDVPKDGVRCKCRLVDLTEGRPFGYLLNARECVFFDVCQISSDLGTNGGSAWKHAVIANSLSR